MVKKASELKSIRDLPISPRIATTLINRGYEPEDVVRLGRNIRHLTKTASSRPKWQIELVDALDNCGYIRHDIDEHTFGVIGIYFAAYNGEDNEGYREMLSFTNEFYEHMKGLEEDEIKAITEYLRLNLGWLEMKTVGYRYKIFDGTSWSISNIAYHLGLDARRVAQIEAVAIKKLRSEKIRKLLPKICLG